MSTATLTAELSLSEVTARCREAQRSWQQATVKARLQPVRALRHLLVREQQRLCAAVASDIGKQEDEVIAGELLPLADGCRYLEKHAARLLRPRKVSLWDRPLWMWGQRDTVHRRPRGVVGIIGTWNYPLFLNGVQMMQALTAGNGVVWKPSEVAPVSATILHALVHEAGFPAELVTRLPATREGGAQLLEADIDHLVFTGAASTGRRIATRLGERLISSTLELSGLDAMFVLEDADVELAARAAWFGATGNRGQTCIAVRRVFVHHSRYESFKATLQPLLATAPSLRLALSSQAQQARALVEQALSAGAHLLGTPSSPPDDPSACCPTVLTEVRPEMAFWREAPFAPLLGILPFDNLTDALAQDARCPYGLGVSIFTRNIPRALELAEKLRAGVVTINDVIAPTAHPVSPFGGVKESGWGVTQGAEGLLEMTVPQAVSVKGGRFRPHYDLAPGTHKNQRELLLGLLTMSHAPTLGERLRGLWQLIRAGRSALERS